MQTKKIFAKIEMPSNVSLSGVIADKYAVKVVEEDDDSAWIILEEKLKEKLGTQKKVEKD